jgi:hypothetical protein
MQNIHQILADYNEVKRQEVLAHTWGHLAPEKNKDYSLKILFSVSDWNSQGRSLISTVQGKDLNESPWLYDAIINKIESYKTLKSGVYMIEGVFKNYNISGRAKRIFKLTT